MPNRDQIKLEWWKLPCEKNPDPVAFVDLDDRFIFCNKAWCKLLGYSESELKQKRWQDITSVDDIGSDQSETNSIKRGEKEEYYLEKEYIRKDRTTVTIKLYVHKYPEEGTHEGYVVFAKRLTSEDYEDLKGKFLDLQKTVLILQQNAVANEFVSIQLSSLEKNLEQHKELTRLIMERDRATSINIGDQTSGDRSNNKAGRDNLIESRNNNGVVILLSVIASILLIGLIVSIVVFCI